VTRVKWAAAAAVVVLLGAQVLLGAGRAAATSGLTLVVATSQYDSLSAKTASAVCPAGTTLLGGGGRIVDGEGYVALTSVKPVATFVRYSVVAKEIAAYGGVWEVSAYAICGADMPAVEIVSATSAPSYGTAEATAWCPFGTVVLGTGAGVRGAADATLQWSRPYDTAVGAYVTASGIIVPGANPTETFRVDAFAVCGPRPAGYEIGATGTLAYTGRLLQISNHCSQDKRVIGTGLTKADSNGYAHVDGMFPTADLTQVWTVSRQATTTFPVALGAWSICVQNPVPPPAPAPSAS
jgi:hypothetical protein